MITPRSPSRKSRGCWRPRTGGVTRFVCASSSIISQGPASGPPLPPVSRGDVREGLWNFTGGSGAAMFEKVALLDRFNHLYKRDPPAAKLQEVLRGEPTLEPRHLRSLLLVVTRNVSTDSRGRSAATSRSTTPRNGRTATYEFRFEAHSCEHGCTDLFPPEVVSGRK